MSEIYTRGMDLKGGNVAQRLRPSTVYIWVNTAAKVYSFCILFSFFSFFILKSNAEEFI